MSRLHVTGGSVLERVWAESSDEDNISDAEFDDEREESDATLSAHCINCNCTFIRFDV